MHLKNPLHLEKPAWKRAIAPTLTAALAVTGAAILAAPAASAAPAATPATQTVDVTLNYSCDVYVNSTQPVGTAEFQNQQISSEVKTSLPTTVNPGQTIPKTPITIVNDFTALLNDAKVIGAVSAKGGANLTSTYVINNKPVTSAPFTVTAPLVQIPPPAAAGVTSGAWFDTANGSTSAVTVPKAAGGDIIVQSPSKIIIESDLSPNADGSDSFPTTLSCTAPSGEDLDLGRISVIPAGAQTVDVTNTYLCDVYPSWATVTSEPETSGSPGQQMTGEVKLTLPTSVSPGQTIPATDVTFSWSYPTIYFPFANLVFQNGDVTGLQGTVAGAALTVHVPGGQNGPSPLNNLTTPLIPVASAEPWDIPATGTTSAISVPANASGNITLSAPHEFTVNWDEPLTATSTIPPGNLTAGSNTVDCTAVDGADLSLASIHITPPAAHSVLTAASPKASTFGKSVSVPVGVSLPASAPGKAARGSGTQTIDELKQYTCNAWFNQTSVPTDNTPPDDQGLSMPTRIDLNLPESVAPGDTIPASDVAISLGFPGSFPMPADSTPDDFTGADNVSITNAGLDVDGQSSPLTGVANTALNPATAVTLPPPPVTTGGQYMFMTADGSTSPITVPANATSDLTINRPQQYDLEFTLEPSDTGTADGVTATPVAMQCAGSTDAAFIASVGVNQAAAPVTHGVPTGKVLITRDGRGVGQGTLSKGKANVVIAGTALPVGKSTLKVTYPGDSNTLAAPSKTITVVKTKASPTLAVHVTPGKVAAGAIFPTVNVRLSGPGKAHGGKFTVTVGSVHKTASLLFDGTQSVQLPPFASAGRKVIRVSYAGNANFVAKTVTAGLNVTKTRLGKFAIKVKPGRIIAKKTRATLLITLGAPDKLGHGLVTVRLAGRLLAKKLITGTGRITLPKFPSAGRKVLHLTFAGNGSVVAKTVTKAVKVTRAPKRR